ncbi:MAG TPA: hypothetical protein VIC26_14465 [Marinagarivorans sp.]
MVHLLRRTRIAASLLSGLIATSLFAQAAYAIDFIAPQIEHKLTTEAVPKGGDHLVTARVTDDTGVDKVIVHYRARGTRDFDPIEMQNLDGSSHYEALIVGQNIHSAGIEYFFEATDGSGNTLEMYGSDGEPFAIAVVDQEVSVVNKINITVPDGARGGSARNHTSSQSVLPIKKKSNSKTWLWVGLGVLAAAVVAGAAGGGSDSAPGGGGTADNTGDLDIATPVPIN